jgi:hypothetical protein
MAGKETKTANWTIMVYMAAQNLLANFAVESLKQLKSIAGNDVVVAAQLHDDIDREIHRHIFCEAVGSTESSEPEIIELGAGIPVKHDVDMAKPETLTRFLNWAYEACPAQRYCLVLWSEGPFLEDTCYVDRAAKTTRTCRLMPVALKNAMDAAKITEAGKLEIVFMDACCVSMLETAYELQGSVKFMIASEEEVPDLSFPYHGILQYIRQMREKSAGNVAAICSAVTQYYIAAYRDYLCNDRTSMRRVTLSGLCLEKARTVKDPLKELSQALIAAAGEKDLRHAIRVARANTKAFVAGLYADVRHFCEELSGRLSKLASQTANSAKLAAACQEVCKVLSLAPENGFIIANQALENNCNGISVYFPFVTEKDQEEIARAQREKGGLDLPLKFSLDRIESIEEDYSSLQLSRDTDWYKFIAHGWSLILAAEVPNDLDLHYSAAQCAANLLSLTQELQGSGKASSLSPVGATQELGHPRNGSVNHVPPSDKEVELVAN